MSLRCRGAPAAGVIFVIVFLLTNYFQPICSKRCTSGPNCSRLTQPRQARRTCSSDAFRDITVTESAREARVQWTILGSACQIQYITVRYKAYGKQACGSSLALPNTQYAYVPYANVNQSECVIYGLEPYTSYDIQIQPTYTQAGHGLWNKKWIITAPGAPPRLSITVGLVKRKQIIFNWIPLTCNTVNGVFEFYNATLRKDGIQIRQPQIFSDMAVSSVKYTYLEPCTTYTLDLRARNRGGLSSAAALAARTKAKVNNARVSQQSSRSLEVAWDVAAQCQGTIINYTLTYELTRREGCRNGNNVEPNLITLSPSSGNSYEITSLQPFATYAISFSITGGAEEEISLTGTTITTAPPRLNITVGSVKSKQIIFNWIPLTCNTVNGAFEFYSATLRKDGIQIRQPQIFSEMAVSSVRYTYLEPCTTYTLDITARNRGGHFSTTELAARTKAKVTSARVSQRRSRSLEVAWDVDTQCQGTPINFTLTYILTRRKACSEGLYVELNPTTITRIYRNTYEITSLQPFAIYAISISITGGPDEEFSLTESTMPSDPVGVAYLHPDERNPSKLKFDWWKPSCADLHGYFECYSYKLIRGNGSDTDIVDRGDCTQDHQKTYMMDNLKACTWYRFEVKVVTMTEDGLRTSEWDSLEALTHTRAPGVPNNVRNSQGSRSVSDATITWEAPTDSPCEPEGYIVTRQLLYKDMCERPLGGTVESANVDRHTMYNTIQGLFSYSQYKVCVRGRNTKGDGDPACFNLTTDHKAPSEPPDRVEYTNKSYDILTFTWNKPRCGYRNGPISHYKYILNAIGSNVSRRGRVTGGENGGNITFTDLIPGTMYSFMVRANNYNLSGTYGPSVEANTNITIYHPPGNVVVTSWNETTAVIEWLAANYSAFNTTGYRIVCWQSGLKKNTSIVVPYGGKVCAPTCLMQATITGLKPATNHSIQVTAVYKYGEKKSSVLQFQTPEEVRESSSRKAVMLPVLVCMFLLIFVLLLVIASLLYSRKTNRPLFNPERLFFRVQGILNALRRTGTALNKSTPMSSSRNRNHTEQELNGGGLEMEITCRVSETNNHEYNHEMESNMSSEIYANVPAQDTKHGAIPVGQLLGYLARRNADGSNSLDDDFKSLPSQKLHSQYIALKAENKEKNRFINILPYDNSRVNLTVVHGDPHSDYINASFIDGYRTPKKYIAAQGPNKASVDDFWRMMWQYDCRKIVMLTNLRESNKKKCEKYWPTESVAYGGIWVSMTNEKINDHFTVRYLNLVCNNTGRDVVQYHYTTWPDMGVPEYPSHLMNFIKITREPLKSPKGPTVVHCSAGVGRTGTFLTLDAMLDQIETEQAVHIHAFIVQMRQKRPNMVQTKKQYRFIYEALLQELTCGDTSIPRNAFGESCQSLLSTSNGVTGIQRQFELLEALTILPQDEETAAARSEDNASKNRFSDKVPVGRTRPFLMTEVEGRNDYINASFLPGYVTRNQFIGTQTPLPNTVVDFWRLVVDYKVETIVMLHGNTKDKKYSQYWPTEGSQRYGPFKIDVKKEEYKRPVMHRTLEVTKTDSKKASPKTVKQLQLASCPPPLDVPATLTDVIDLYRALLTALGSTEWKEGDSPLLVHCRDGEGMTGAFCAFLAVMDQLNAKQTIDVFHACKKLRTTRPGAVASLAQYQFIYEAVKSHLISSTIYENVAKKI